MKYINFLLISVAIVGVVLASCPADYSIPYLVADTRQLTSHQSGKNFQYALPAAMSQTPSVAISNNFFI